jgi:uncharacterized protein (DUF111 family)
MQPEEPQHSQDMVILVECNLDDMTGEALGYALERLLAAGALDAWFTPVYMKKNRPGVVLSVLCRPAERAMFCDLLLRETSTLGVRWRPYRRQIAERRTDQVVTPWGPVRRKLKILAGQVVGIKPEYEDCARLARDHQIPLETVFEAARRSPPQE